MIKRLIEETIPIIEYICTGYKEHRFYNCNDGLGKFTNWGGADSSHFGINMAIFEKIFYDLSKRGLISIDNIGNSNDENDRPIKDEMDIDYKILDLKGLEKYLLDIKTAYPKRKEPLIHKKTLELIARDIGEMDNGINLVEFLKDCGVEAELIIYPNTKWKMIYDILEYFAYSDKAEDKENIFKVIEGAIHPLMHNGDEEVAKKYENKFNSLLKYDGFVFKKRKLKKIEQEPECDEKSEEDDEEDVFSYDGGISSPYNNTDLELFILKKIQLEHKRRDDRGFLAKELSFNNDSLEEICRVINKLMEDKILYLSANTRPERFENEEGIEDKSGFINWEMVEKLDKNHQKMDTESGFVIFDTEILDEVKLKGRIDIAIEEFMNDKIYTPLGIMMDKTEIEKILASIEHDTNENKKDAVMEAIMPKKTSYPYYKQREIIIEEISKDDKERMEIPLNYFRDKRVDVLKTLLALEKENLLRITELRSNPIYDDKGNFLGKWSGKDNPVAKIYTLKAKVNKQEPMLLKIVEMPELKIKGFEEKSKQKNALMVELVSKEIHFNDEEAKIVIGEEDCQLPPFKNEHFFCRAMYEFPAKEFIDWSIIYEKYEGIKSKDKSPNDPTKDKRAIQDTMYALNKRIKRVINTSDNLFTWQEKSIKRNY